VVCGVCGHLFVNESGEETVECPQCRRRVPRQRILDV
jgi:DNA-directed RNA polymerase subunit RPC12/RpoP